MSERTCAYPRCGMPFEPDPTNPGQRYCCRDCYDLARAPAKRRPDVRRVVAIAAHFGVADDPKIRGILKRAGAKPGQTLTERRA